MKRVLFVDDEANVLQGLQRMLRPLRKEWDMKFAPGGPEALELMRESLFDIVVSDMKMPGMDGADFLTKVQEEHPETIRIILSGHADIASVLKSVGPTHQYLAKPCDPEVLKATVNRALSLRAILQSESVKKLISQLDTVPSMPEIFHQVVDELQSEDCSLDRVGKVIARDIGMSAKVLKLVNSAYFGLPSPIPSVERAVTFLGLEVINTLVLGLHIFKEYKGADIPGFSLDEVWRHSTETALCARAIAKVCGLSKKAQDDSFMAGMLHDVGKLVLAANVPDDYGPILSHSKQENERLAEAERAAMGATHGEIGAYLLGLWGMPDSIIEAVAVHSTPFSSVDELQRPRGVVFAANCLVREAWGETTNLEETLEGLGISDRLPEWADACAPFLSEVADR